MKKDIVHPRVEEVAIAIIKDKDTWNVYLLNMKSVDIQGVLITSKGYGKKEGEKVKTSILRHFWEKVGAHAYVKIEPIMENLFGLSNEYWLSFYVDGIIYDKKYIFLAESITEGNHTTIPLINKKGVMIQ